MCESISDTLRALHERVRYHAKGNHASRFLVYSQQIRSPSVANPHHYPLSGCTDEILNNLFLVTR
jgi:hypothetical protein